jgi:hypothetical protein
VDQQVMALKEPLSLLATSWLLFPAGQDKQSPAFFSRRKKT